jgi:hypothetical protein
MSETNASNTLPDMTLEQVKVSVRNYLTQGNAGNYGIGRLYNYTVTTKLAEKNGYANAQAFFSQNFKELAQSTLSRYGAVARQFTEEACKTYGVAKLALLSTYAKAAQFELPSNDDLGNISIDVPQDGGAVIQMPYAECSVDDLLQAVKQKRKPQKPMSATDEARVNLIQESFSRHFAKGARVELKASVKDGKALLTIQGVPVDDVERLVEALMDGLPPRLVRAAV